MAIVARMGIALVATYLAFLAGDLALRLLDARTPGIVVAQGLKHLYRADPVLGYALSPDFDGVYADGLVEASYRTTWLA